MGDIKFYSPVDFDDTSSGVTIEGNLVANAGIGVGTTTVYSNSLNLNNSGTFRIGNAEMLSKSSNDLSVYQDKLRITSSGNVGIGTTSPATPLDVAGAGRFSGFVRSNFLNTYDNSKSIIGAPSNYVSIYGGSGAEAIRIDSSGNIGIGTTSPAYQLHLSGSGRSLGVKNYITTTLVANSILVGYDSSAVYLGYGYGAKDIHVGSNNSGKVLIRNTNGLVVQYGNVGIGTTSPSQKLHVSGSARITGAIYDSSNDPGTSGQVLSSTASGTDWVDQGDVVAGSADKALSVTLTVKNTEAVALTKGQVVCAAPSATPPSGNLIEVKLADNNGTDSMPAIGVLNEDLDAAGGANDEGEAIMFGKVSGIDTSAFDVGDEVFVSDTAGALTKTKPTGVKYIQKIGVVIRDDASNGTIEVFGAGRTNDVPTPLYVDHANQRLGIGTTSPGQKLTVDGDVGITTSNQLFVNDIAAYTGAMTIGPTGASELKFRTTGSEKMRITSGGSVGIGTTSPGSVLHVQQDKVTLNTTNLDNGTAVGLHLTYPDTSLSGGEGIALAMGMNGRGRSYIANLSASTNKDSSDMLFYTENGGVIGERVRINNSGKVGIGTTNPGYKLEISDDTDTTVNLLRLRNADSLYSQTWDFQLDTGKHLVVTGGSGSGGIVLKPGSAGLNVTSTSAAQIFLNSATGNDSVLNFRENSSQKGKIGYDTSLSGIALVAGSGAFSSADMVVLDNGNVGIGTTSPSEKLDVAGSIVVNTGQSLKWGAGATRIVGLDGSYIAIYPNNSEKVRFLSNGNVLIGTTTDNGDKLTVEGNISGSGTGSFESVAIPGTTADYYIGGSGGGAATNELRIGSTHTPNNIALELYHSLNPVSLGIGYSNGGALAFIESVHGSYNTNTHMLFKPGGTETWRIGSHGSSASNKFQIQPAAAANDFIIADNSGNAILYSDTSTQRIGIGTTSPDYKLDVEGSVNGDIDARIYNSFDDNNASSTPKARLWLEAASNNGYFRVHGAPADTVSKHQVDLGSSAGGSFLTFTLGVTERMRITNSGNIGIGITNPSEKLSIATSTNASAEIGYAHVGYIGHNTYAGFSHVNTNTASGYAILQASSGETYINAPTGQNINFRINNSTHMILNNSGNIGIGTTSPSQKLDVVGSAKVSGQTHTGTLRVDATAAGPNPVPQQSPSDAIVRTAGDTAIYLSEPDEWLEININGTNYVIPAYEA